MKHLTFLLAVFAILVGCTPKTTTGGAVKKGKEAKTLAQALTKLEKNELNFETLEGKVKARYNDGDRSLNLKATIKMQKDEKIWISAGMFGFEGARILITPTRVQAINRLEKTYYDEPVEKLQELAGLPVDFYTLQNLLLAQVLFVNEEDASFTTEQDKVKVVTNLEDLVNTFTLTKPVYVLNEQVLTDNAHDLSMEVSYENYQDVEGQLFPFTTAVNVTGAQPIQVNLEVQKVELDTDPNFDFSISKRYTRETLD